MPLVYWPVDRRIYPARITRSGGRMVARFADGTSCVAVRCARGDARGRATFMGVVEPDLSTFEALLSRARAARRRAPRAP